VIECVMGNIKTAVQLGGVSSRTLDLQSRGRQCCLDYFSQSNALQLQLLGSV